MHARTGQLRVQVLFLGTTLLGGLFFPSQAMDRWAALSQIESGNNDRAVGAAGEISRYQMKPEVWQRYAQTNADCLNPQTSLAIARKIMQERLEEFEQSFHRPPTDFEFYVLWNAPAQIEQPCPNVRERAERFCNLVQVPDNPAPNGGAGKIEKQKPSSVRN